jgi:hypothetical protein
MKTYNSGTNHTGKTHIIYEFESNNKNKNFRELETLYNNKELDYPLSIANEITTLYIENRGDLACFINGFKMALYD